MRHVELVVEGKVQGVFFRKHTQQIAMQLGIKGFVRNQPDGSVYIIASGSLENIQQLIEWCKIGPRAAVVESVNINDVDEQSFEKFEIKGTQ